MIGLGLDLFKLANSACGTKTGFLPSLYDGLPCDNGSLNITSLDSIWRVVFNGIRIAMALAGGLAVIFIIVGGIFYVIAAGDPSRVKRAKEILIQAITGLIITLSAYAIVTYISKGF